MNYSQSSSFLVLFELRRVCLLVIWLAVLITRHGGTQLGHVSQAMCSGAGVLERGMNDVKIPFSPAQCPGASLQSVDLRFARR